jgi:hypothetical protein
MFGLWKGSVQTDVPEIAAKDSSSVIWSPISFSWNIMRFSASARSSGVAPPFQSIVAASGLEYEGQQETKGGIGVGGYVKVVH